MSAFFFRVSGVFDQLLRTGRAQLKFLIMFPNAFAVHLELLFNNFCGLLNSQQCIFIRTLITFVDYLVFSSASSFT